MEGGVICIQLLLPLLASCRQVNGSYYAQKQDQDVLHLLECAILPLVLLRRHFRCVFNIDYFACILACIA